MLELHLVYVALHAVIAILSAAVAVAAWRHRSARGAKSIAAMMLGVAIWSGAAAVMWDVTTLQQQIFWERATSLGSWMVPVGFLALALEMARAERWLTPKRLVPIALVSFALNNMEWINPGRLYDAAFVGRAVGTHMYFSPQWGPLYWAFVGYSYALILVAIALLFRVVLRSSGAERSRATILLIGGALPTVASVITQSGLITLDIDLAPVAFLATGALWLSAILRGDSPRRAPFGP